MRIELKTRVSLIERANGVWPSTFFGKYGTATGSTSRLKLKALSDDLNSGGEKIIISTLVVCIFGLITKAHSSKLQRRSRGDPEFNVCSNSSFELRASKFCLQSRTLSPGKMCEPRTV